jgi:hypothetical protein
MLGNEAILLGAILLEALIIVPIEGDLVFD